jgi:hypothetical protein
VPKKAPRECCVDKRKTGPTENEFARRKLCRRAQQDRHEAPARHAGTGGELIGKLAELIRRVGKA